MKVSSTVKLNSAKIKQLSQAAVRALELTGEALHKEVVQAQVVPRKDGALQGEAFFLDTSESKNGKVSLVHATPYARRLYFHPEYKFHREPWEEFVVEKDGKKRSFATSDEAKKYKGKGGTIHHYTHDGNPNAKGLWYEDWLSGGKHADFAKKTYEKIYKQLGGV